MFIINYFIYNNNFTKTFYYNWNIERYNNVGKGMHFNS